MIVHDDYFRFLFPRIKGTMRDTIRDDESISFLPFKYGIINSHFISLCNDINGMPFITDMIPIMLRRVSQYSHADIFRLQQKKYSSASNRASLKLQTHHWIEEEVFGIRVVQSAFFKVKCSDLSSHSIVTSNSSSSLVIAQPEHLLPAVCKTSPFIEASPDISPVPLCIL